MEVNIFVEKINDIISKAQETIRFVTQNYQIDAQNNAISILHKLDNIRGQFIKENNSEYITKVEQTMVKVQEIINLIYRNLQIPSRDKLLGVIQKLNYIKENFLNENNRDKKIS